MIVRKAIEVHTRAFWWWNRKHLVVELEGGTRLGQPKAGVWLFIHQGPLATGNRLPLRRHGKYAAVRIDDKLVVLDYPYDKLVERVGQISWDQVQKELAQPPKLERLHK